MQKFFHNLSKILNNLKFFFILIIYVNCYDHNISWIFYLKNGSHVRLRHPSWSIVLHYHPETVHCSTKIRTPLKWLSLPYIHCLWPEYFIDFLFERWIPCQASTSVLVLCYITTQRQYTAVQKMRTPLKKLSLHYNLGPCHLLKGVSIKNKVKFMLKLLRF